MIKNKIQRFIIASALLIGVFSALGNLKNIDTDDLEVFNDCGSVTFSGTEVWVEYSPTFTELLDGTLLPKVIITAHGSAEELYIKEKIPTAFLVSTKTAAVDAEFDWIAMISSIEVWNHQYTIPGVINHQQLKEFFLQLKSIPEEHKDRVYLYVQIKALKAGFDDPCDYFDSQTKTVEQLWKEIPYDWQGTEDDLNDAKEANKLSDQGVNQ